jgi:hypothetical protein
MSVLPVGSVELVDFRIPAAQLVDEPLTPILLGERQDVDQLHAETARQLAKHVKAHQHTPVLDAGQVTLRNPAPLCEITLSERLFVAKCRDAPSEGQ